MHATLARQRLPKLSYYCPNTNTGIYYANPSGRSMPIGDGTRNNKQKSPKLGSILLPNYGQCSCLTTRRLSLISTKTCSKSLHYIAKISYLCKIFHATFMQKLICTRFTIGFKNGLPSIYMLKGQPRSSSLI